MFGEFDFVLIALVAFLGTAVISRLTLGCFINALVTRSILEEPNARSSHKKPIPTGAGAAVVPVALIAWLWLSSGSDSVSITLVAGALALMLVSLIDDLSMLPVLPRLLTHVVAVGACLWEIPADARILLADLPLWFDRLLSALFWLWFINLFNFMDGIDGIAATETIAICLGLALVGTVLGIPAHYVLLAIAIAGSMLGFLAHNWHPAKIILGDVGSIPIGFILGWLLIELALSGYLIAALILPLYYLADASITLARRMLRGAKFWSPHREHFYQQPIVAGVPHSKVVLTIIPANVVLIAAAWLSLTQPWLGSALAVVTVAALLFRLNQMSKSSERASPMVDEPAGSFGRDID